MSKVRAAVLAIALLLPLTIAACGRLKPAAAPGDDGGESLPDAPNKTDASDVVPRCLLGSSPIATSTVCGAHPDLCGDVCGSACVDLVRDPNNCGACGTRCEANAACIESSCGAKPKVLVPAAPECRSIRLVHDAGSIVWADLGHGTINRVPTSGGAPTVLAAGTHPAAIYTGDDQPLLVNGEPVAAGIVARAGIVFWIASADEVTLDGQGLPHGGAGSSILCAEPGAAPATLLPASLAPAAISAIALSPDGETLYFAAGTRLYKIPSKGTATEADIIQVGFTSGPEHGFATALAADERRLYFPSSVDTWVEIFDLTKACDSTAASNYSCPSLVFGSHPIPLLDTVLVQDGFLYWGKENNVWRADLSKSDPSLEGHATASDTIDGFSVTGFAVGARYVYFGESDLIERGTFAGVESGGPPRAQAIARGQTWPTSFALDDTNVYWTTTACDIGFTSQ